MPQPGTVVVLAGGTGGAKLARGLREAAGDDLVVIANTGDDVEVCRAYVSPDPDLVTFWLADRIDERGWGLSGDTFAAMDQLRALGADVWFNLGDRDLAICLDRARRLAEGARLTETAAGLARAMGLRARVLPMSDQPVRTRVLAGGQWLPFQEFMIRRGAEGPVDGIELAGIQAAVPTPEVLAAIASARAIVIGPSNPVVSIGPILELPGLRAALRAAAAPVVAVSPIVGGEVLKGPTGAFLRWAGVPMSAAGVAAYYGDLLDGMVADEPVDGLPVLEMDTLLSDEESRRRVGEQTLQFVESLAT